LLSRCPPREAVLRVPQRRLLSLTTKQTTLPCPAFPQGGSSLGSLVLSQRWYLPPQEPYPPARPSHISSATARGEFGALRLWGAGRLWCPSPPGLPRLCRFLAAQSVPTRDLIFFQHLAASGVLRLGQTCPKRRTEMPDLIRSLPWFSRLVVESTCTHEERAGEH